MTEIKDKLEVCLKSLEDVSSFTIPKVNELSDEVYRKIPEVGSGDFSIFSREEKEMAERLVIRLFSSRVSVYENCIDKWDKGLLIPDEKELKSLKSYQKDKFDEIILPTYAGLKKKFPSLYSKYEEEERVSRESKKTLDRLLKNDKYRQKAELLNKISELKEKIKNDPNNQDYKRELSELQQQLEDLKDIPQDKKENLNDFPTKLVVGIGIGVVVILLIALLYSQFNRRN